LGRRFVKDDDRSRAARGYSDQDDFNEHESVPLFFLSDVD
jgi:hypothetical protein